MDAVMENQEKEEKLHGQLMNVMLWQNGLSPNLNNEDVAAVKSASLIELLTANATVREKPPKKDADGRFSGTISTSDKAVAKFYIGLHDDDYLEADAFENACNALDDAFPDTRNGHAVIIDGEGYYSLVTLLDSGDGADETLFLAETPGELLKKIRQKLEESEE